jgi:glutamine amidotransferase
MIVIVDTGMANVGSVHNIVKYLGYDAIVTKNQETINTAKKIILPGVGSFDAGMDSLNNSGMKDVLNQKVLVEKTPILGICLGMQMMTRGSEEGSLEGLGWFEADTIKFDQKIDQNIRIPHMGWNNVFPLKYKEMFLEINQETRFYFVHSYYVRADNTADVLTTTKHGIEFHSAIQKDNIFGVQFHPEKSHKFGMHFMKSFIQL